jgi:hypothetical protein
MKHPTLKQRYERICQTYVDQFCAKHNCEIDFISGGHYMIGDAFLSLDVIRYDIDNEVPKGEVFTWFWKWVDVEGFPNFENYLKLDKQ